MPTNKTQAAKLLSAAEMDVFNASLGAAIKELSPARLAGKVKRARTLRDKFRDLLKRQKLASRARTASKAGTSGAANERTERKAEVFDEVLTRFLARHEKVEAAAVRAAAKQAAAAQRAAAAKAKAAAKAPAKAPVKVALKAAVKAAVKAAGKTAGQTATPGSPVKTARSSKAPSRAPRAAANPLAATPQAVDAAAKRSKIKAAGVRNIQAHVASKGRRNQAKRDS